MDATMPPIIVLIVCKTLLVGPVDQNAAYTGYENREWSTEHSMMVCRRQEVQMTDPSENQGASPKPFTPQSCQRASIGLGVAWDMAHRSSSYRFWRVACPVPIVRKNPDGSQDIISWKLPECPHRDVVICEVDSAI